MKKTGAFALRPKKSTRDTLVFYSATSVVIFQHERRFITTQWALSPCSNIHLDFDCDFEGVIFYQPEKYLGVYVENNSNTPLIIERGRRLCEVTVYRQVVDRTRKRKRDSVPTTSNSTPLLQTSEEAALNQVTFIRYRDNVVIPYARYDVYLIYANSEIEVPANGIKSVSTGIGFLLPDTWIIRYYRRDGRLLEGIDSRQEVKLSVENKTDFTFTVTGVTLIAYAKVFELFRSPRICVVDLFSGEVTVIRDETQPCTSSDLFSDQVVP